MDVDGRDSRAGSGSGAPGAGLNVVADADVDPARYLSCLNEGFGAWGGEREAELVFGRAFDGQRPERFVLTHDDDWLAGSAVSWRALATPGGKPELVGIMTGSWTLAVARGQGCFARIIELSRDACAARGARWLLAFVTEVNASRRQLERAGSIMIPSWYMWSPEDAVAPRAGPNGFRVVDADDRRIEECRERQSSQRAGTTRFVYSTPEMWRQQFIDRTLPTELLLHDELGLAVVEKHPEFDRLLTAIPYQPDQRLALATAVWQRALDDGKRFFAYTTRRDERDLLTERCGLGGIAGFMTAIPAGDAEARSSWGDLLVESGDRT